MGLYGTMIGAGGGFIIVPLLLLAYRLPSGIAVGTSLFAVFFNALSGTIAYMRQGLVDYRAGVVFALATLPGAVAGAYALQFVQGRTFSLLFGLLMCVLSVYLLLRPERRANKQGSAKKTRFTVDRTIHTKEGHTYQYSYHELGGAAFSSVVGFLSSLLGIGGGIIHVPALIQMFSFPAHVATATSHFILVFSALVGAGSHYLFGDIDFKIGWPLAMGLVVGAQFGARLAKRVQVRMLVRLLAGGLFLVGLRLFLKP